MMLYVLALKSNLILLILSAPEPFNECLTHFKFQSDSINTRYEECPPRPRWPLNSNLILLIQDNRVTLSRWKSTFKFQSDSINTTAKMRNSAAVKLFKFQSDSINTSMRLQVFLICPPLNSNLILLIRYRWFNMDMS